MDNAMKQEEDKKQSAKPVTYYGKKVYRIHPLLARVKSVVEKSPDYGDENYKIRYTESRRNE